MKDYK
jgi:dynein heavy chain